MQNWQRKLDEFSRLSGVVRTLAAIKALVPICVAAWTAFLAHTEHLPLAQVVTYSVVSLASALVVVNQARAILGIPQIIQNYENLEYGLSLGEVAVLGFPAEPGKIQFAFEISNNSRVPIQYRVERMNVVVANTTMPIKKYPGKPVLIPLAKSRGFRGEPFPANLVAPLIGREHEGFMEVHILYGRVGEGPSRRYKVTLRLTVHLVMPSFSVANVIEDEVDEPVFSELWDH